MALSTFRLRLSFPLGLPDLEPLLLVPLNRDDGLDPESPLLVTYDLGGDLPDPEPLFILVALDLGRVIDRDFDFELKVAL